MKKWILNLLVIAIVCALLVSPLSALATNASQYHFQAGDLVCVRASASVYTSNDGKWALADGASKEYFGTLKETKKVKVATSRGKRTVKLYGVQIDEGGVELWADDIAPAIIYDDQVIAYDAYKGYMSVDLTTSSVRWAVLNDGLNVASALQQAQKSLGYGKYFKVKVEYFAWELIAHAYAAEFGLPEYSRSSVADCDVTKTDDETEFIIDVARVLWQNGPDKTWV
jgi:hypothetical protein